MPVDSSRRQAFIDWVQGEKQWDTKVFTGKTNDIGDGPDRIPFLNPTLTRDTSGGVPIGHMCRWYGEEGSGKSLTNLGIIYCAQNYPEIVTKELEREIRYWQVRNKFHAMRLKSRLKRLLAPFPNARAAFVNHPKTHTTFFLV